MHGVPAARMLALRLYQEQLVPAVHVTRDQIDRAAAVQERCM